MIHKLGLIKFSYLSYTFHECTCWITAENTGIHQEQIPQNQVCRKKDRNWRVSLRYIPLNAGIRTNKPQQNQEELKKVTQMVKSKNYNHPEIGVLKDSELQRMKVVCHLFRKPFGSQPKRKSSSKKDWPKKKESISWPWRRLRNKKCWG